MEKRRKQGVVANQRCLDIESELGQSFAAKSELWSFVKDGDDMLFYRAKENHSGQIQNS